MPFRDWFRILIELTKQLKWKKVAKTKCMVVRTRQANECRRCTYGWFLPSLARVTTMKYLGVMLDEKLNFNVHINYTIRKAARKFGVLCRIVEMSVEQLAHRLKLASSPEQNHAAYPEMWTEHARMFAVNVSEAMNRVQITYMMIGHSKHEQRIIESCLLVNIPY